MADAQCSAVEEWRVIPGHVNYEVSSFGGVRRIGRHVLKPYKSKQGYVSVSLGTSRLFRVQRLVLLAFMGEPPHEKPMALHRNAIRDDNRLTNLYWGSAYENSQDMIRVGNAMDGSKHPTSKLTDADIQFMLTSPLSHADVARKIGVCFQTVSRIRLGETWVRSSARDAVTPSDCMGAEGKPAKVTIEQVREIRARHARGESVNDISRDYPLVKASIRKIIARTKWKDA